jgi:hypothetical protein
MPDFFKPGEHVPQTSSVHIFGLARAIACAALIGPAIVSLVAQSHPFVLDKPGKWNPPPPIKPHFAAGTTADDWPGVTAWSNQLLEIVRRIPYLSSPVGFEVAYSAAAGPDNLDHTAGLKRTIFITGTVRVSLNPYEKMPQGVFPNSQDAAASFEISVNDLSPIGAGGLDDFMRDEQGRFYTTTKDLSSTSSGYPIYGDAVLLTRSKAPVLIPVSRGRYVQAKIVRMEERVADAKARRAKLAGNSMLAGAMPQLDEAIDSEQHYVDALKGQLAAMSAAERNAPAVVTSDGGAVNLPEFAEPGDADGAHIMYFNPALIDEKLPRTAVQILMVRITSDEEHWPGLAEKLHKELDWSAFEKILQ